jgi:hypothetical protein
LPRRSASVRVPLARGEYDARGGYDETRVSPPLLRLGPLVEHLTASLATHVTSLLATSQWGRRTMGPGEGEHDDWRRALAQRRDAAGEYPYPGDPRVRSEAGAFAHAGYRVRVIAPRVTVHMCAATISRALRYTSRRSLRPSALEWTPSSEPRRLVWERSAEALLDGYRNLDRGFSWANSYSMSLAPCRGCTMTRSTAGLCHDSSIPAEMDPP